MAGTRTTRIVGRLFRAVAICLILAVFILLFWRMCSAGLPAAMRRLAVNDRLREAYATAGDALVLRHQEQDSITRAPHNSGYFSIPRVVFIPEAEQVQLVLRYNKSTLSHLAEDMGLDAVPDPSGSYFDVTLLRSTDLTPEDPDDDLDPATLSFTRFFPSGEPLRADTSLYTYLLYTFDGVTIEDLTVGIFADVYYLGDLDYEADPYGVLCLYDDESAWVTDRLTSADRRALRGE